MMPRSLFIVSVVYLLLVALFAEYWSHSFMSWISTKGNESVVCVVFNILAGLALYGIACLTFKARWALFLFLFVPAITTIAVLFLLLFMFIIRMSSPVLQSIYCFSFAYGILSVLVLHLFPRLYLKKVPR
ncbi:MAG: hypothetical protein JST39_01390 [Bacteroidetes bacterium]|nr:hypothetical protein [Bacteroidota bacterium]